MNSSPSMHRRPEAIVPIASDSASSEADKFDVWMGDHLSTDIGSSAKHYVANTSGKAGISKRRT